MGVNFGDPPFLNPMAAGNPATTGLPTGLGTGGDFLRAIKRSESEPNFEDILFLNGEGDGASGGLGIKGEDQASCDGTALFPEFSTDHCVSEVFGRDRVRISVPFLPHVILTFRRT